MVLGRRSSSERSDRSRGRERLDFESGSRSDSTSRSDRSRTRSTRSRSEATEYTYVTDSRDFTDTTGFSDSTGSTDTTGLSAPGSTDLTSSTDTTSTTELTTASDSTSTSDLVPSTDTRSSSNFTSPAGTTSGSDDTFSTDITDSTETRGSVRFSTGFGSTTDTQSDTERSSSRRGRSSSDEWYRLCRRAARLFGGMSHCENGICTIAFLRRGPDPRSLSRSRRGAPVVFMGFLSFQEPDRRGRALCLGETLLVEGRADPLLNRLRRLHIRVTAVHNNWVFERPRLMYCHFEAVRDPLRFAEQVAEAIGAQGRGRRD